MHQGQNRTDPPPLSVRRPRVVVIGAGFAGFQAARRLERLLPAEAADLVLVAPADYLLYSPLLPDVAAGAVEARHIAVPLRPALPRTRVVLGRVTAIDLDARTLSVEPTDDDRRGGATRREPWDRLIVTPGSVTRGSDVPGVAENAHGLKSLHEALYLRDHLLTQLDATDDIPDGPDAEEERSARLTVVAVGAGYTNTEVVAQMQWALERLASQRVRRDPRPLRWVLVNRSTKVLPELGPTLGGHVAEMLHRRGIEVRLGVTVASATDRVVVLTDGTVVPTRTLIWGAGVTPDPLVSTLGLPLYRGRLVVDPQLRVHGPHRVWAAGDAAAVPDLASAMGSAEEGRPVTPPTAQHAQRQGVAVARNVAASLGFGRARPYRHRDLGLVADLGGRDAVARPLGLPLSGLPAKAVARGYHLLALPAPSNRVRVAADWLFDAVLGDQAAQVSLQPDSPHRGSYDPHSG